jgi:enoyl-CoA hydratase/carnithine racemase
VGTEASAEFGYETIRLERDGPLATVTLDRPERLNAFTEEMAGEILDALDRTDADDDVRAVVFTGAGRAFCAGADLGKGGDTFAHRAEPFEMSRHADSGGLISRRLFDSAKPVIAAINGPAIGIGITMTLAMDFRLVSSTARIGFVFARRGLVPEASSSFFLPRLVGISQAAEWVYTGRIFDASEALASRLVRSVHPPDELLAAARALAEEIASGTSAVAVAASRRMMWQMLAGAGDLISAHEADSEALHVLGIGADVREGVAAFLEKRDAEFPLRVSVDMPDVYDRWAQERGGRLGELRARVRPGPPD